MSRRAFILIGVFWLALVGALVGVKQYTLLAGEDVLLRTVPVDPRDLFRGDYVILRYEISTLDLTALDTDIRPEDLMETATFGATLYTAFSVEEGYAEPTGVFTERPPGRFIRATVRRAGPGQTVELDYGIESFFVPEGRGLEIERQRGEAVEVRVAVDRFGSAAIRALLIDGQAWTP